MDISTARKDLAKLVTNLPVEGIPLERYGKVVALLVRPEYAPEDTQPVKPEPPKEVGITSPWKDLPKAPKNQKSVTDTQAAQRARDELLKKINRG